MGAPLSSTREASLLKEVETWIRQGQGARAREAILQLSQERPDRSLRGPLASLAWRVSLHEVGVRLLNPLVRPGPRKPVQATPEEKAEYAACLIGMGAPEEALILLDSLDEQQTPQALLYRAFAGIAQWDYSGAIAPLTRYTDHPSLTDYQQLVGRANLAAAYVYEKRSTEASTLIEALLEEALSRNYLFLVGILLELRAINFVETRRYEEAENALEQASRHLQGSESPWELFVRKWKAILGLLRAPRSPERLRALREIRAEAQQRRHWETVRQCDEYEAACTGNAALLSHVWFGTPHAAFRDRLLQEFGTHAELPERYTWVLTGDSAIPIPLRPACMRR